jgi:hypothetical protein
MVFIMPKEFLAPDDEDQEPELEDAMAQLNLEPLPVTFEKPEDDKRKHLKALFLKGFVNGKPVTKMLVDGGCSCEHNALCDITQIGKKSG